MDWIGEAMRNGTLLTTMLSKCMECLATCLKSPNPKVSLIAAETLDSLFTTKQGEKCWKLLEEGMYKTLLAPFASKERASHDESLATPSHALDALKHKV